MPQIPMIYDQFGPTQPITFVKVMPDPAEKKSTWDSQIGGSHYKDFVIQPSEYIDKNGFDWYDGNALKYISRHKRKGKENDLKKAIQYIQAQLEKTYGIKSTVTYEG